MLQIYKNFALFPNKSRKNFSKCLSTRFYTDKCMARDFTKSHIQGLAMNLDNVKSKQKKNQWSFMITPLILEEQDRLNSNGQ